LLGQQNGREITIEHAFEAHTRQEPNVQGGYLLDGDRFSTRLEQSQSPRIRCWSTSLTAY
jgi:COP9 signalosome complex subunit 6